MPPTPELRTVGVVGAGAWGTALALAARRAGRRVVLWAREPELRAAMAASRVNARFLPGVPLPDGLVIAADLDEAAGGEAVLLAAPAQHLRTSLAELTPRLGRASTLVLCAKGLERGTDLLMTEVAQAAAPDADLAILSGPSFAADVAAGLPTAVTLAARSLARAEALAAALASHGFRPYASDDPTGVAIGGAVKNVLAIACGVSDGRGLGASARAALLTRGFAEMVRFGRALGARSETLMGLSGLGDLTLTCSSVQSRNFAYGFALGRGSSPDAAAAAAKGVVEGAATAAPLRDRARALGVAMPIVEAVAALVEGRAQVDHAIAALLARPLRPESDAAAGLV